MVTSDERILIKFRIAGGDGSRFITVGVMQWDTTSWQHRSSLQQWRCDSVIDFFAAYKATMIQKFTMLFNGPDHPQNCPFPCGEISTPSNARFIGPNESPTQTASTAI